MFRRLQAACAAPRSSMFSPVGFHMALPDESEDLAF